VVFVIATLVGASIVAVKTKQRLNDVSP
jgi:hypothetical protein